MKIFVNVLICGYFDSEFTYIANQDVVIGQIVRVPLKKREVIGCIVEKYVNEFDNSREIIFYYPFILSQQNIDFLNWVSSYTLNARGMVLKMLLPEATIFNGKDNKSKISNDILYDNIVNIQLNDDQQNAYTNIKKNMKTKPVLLKGITGSGKTEVFFKIISEIFSEQKQILVMIPEISLMPQTVSRFIKYFGIHPLVWHSLSTHKNRKIAWEQIILGNPCVVIGTRSSLFLPFSNLGLIVVDEEHDSSYKQEDVVIYNGRDMALVKSKIHECPIILSSATPSLETLVNVSNHKYEYTEINKRFSGALLPKIELIDMKQSEKYGNLSNILIQAIRDALKNGEQVLLFVNRRGYAPVNMCKKCGYRQKCKFCDSVLVAHKIDTFSLICHHCGYKSSVPTSCENCHEKDSFIFFGIAVEKIYEEIICVFPNTKVAIASSDIVNSSAKMEIFVKKILDGSIDIIIATQILSKGHHFPKITTIGIVDGDCAISDIDIRAGEKTYQMISQVSGRAGREGAQGKILIQTYNPSDPLLTKLQLNEVDQFLEIEKKYRKQAGYPPFGRLVAVIISGKSERDVREFSHYLVKFKIDNVKILGPVPAPISLLRNKFRWRILYKSDKNFPLSSALKTLFLSIKIPKTLTVQVDVDPMSFM